LTTEEFDSLKTQLDAKTPSQVQAYALAWTQPYRVDCMSVTAAWHSVSTARTVPTDAA
jgi:hypothetical protein